MRQTSGDRLDGHVQLAARAAKLLGFVLQALLGEFAHFLRDLHRAELGAAHRAKVRHFGGVLGQRFVVVLLGGFRVESQIELVLPAEIKARFEEDGYLCDTHTAVAFRVAEAQRTAAPMVVLSTASPFKFPRDVLAALGEEAPASDFAAMAALTAKTGAQAPASLRELDTLEVRFKTVLQPAEIRAAALR